MSPEVTNSFAELNETIKKINVLFGQDLELVRAAAEHHGIKMNAGSLQDQLIENQYNLRLPDENDIATFLTADSISVICMDRRQSAQVAKYLESELVMAQAGGPVQPNEERMNLLVDFLVAAKALNNSLKVNLVYHLGLCGGANHFTNKKMQEHFDNGFEDENMKIFADKLVTALINKGFNKNDINLYVAHVEDDKFIDISKIKH